MLVQFQHASSDRFHLKFSSIIVKLWVCTYW